MISDKAASWAVNTTYTTSLVKMLPSIGAPPTGLSEDAERMLQAPWSQRWWPGQLVIETFLALEQKWGTLAVEKLALETSRRGMGPIVRPLISVLLALASSPGRALFSRVASFTEIGCRNVAAVYLERPSGCELTFTFPEAVHPVSICLWKGMVGFGLEVARSGSIRSVSVGSKEHRFELDW